MDTKNVAFLTLGVVGILGISYIAYFDHMRRKNPDFRKRLKRDRKRAARAKRAKEEDAQNKLANFARQALDEVNKEDFPETVEGKEKYFMDQVSKGEALFGGGEAGYQAAAICFYKALKVYPSPLELIMIYQKTIPEAVFNLVYTMMSLEVKKKQDEYWEVFPPKSMNVKIQRVDEPNQNPSEKDKIVRRGVFATKDFKEGEAIYSEMPIVSALDPRLENGDFCSYCLREISGIPVDDDQDLFSAVYCSEACKIRAGEEYTGILFSKANSSGPSNKESRLVDLIKNGNVKYPLMIARFLARMVYEETQKVATGIDEEYNTFDHVERLRYLEVQATPKDLKEIELLRELLASKVPGIEEFISEERYMILKGRLLYNAYAITTAQNDDIHIQENLDETIRSSTTSPVTGAGFYCVTSHLAHSCAPNAEIKFQSNNHELTLVATKPIQAGEELNISYIQLGNRDTSDRRAELSTNWRLNCLCKRCMADDLQISTDDDERNWVDEDQN